MSGFVCAQLSGNDCLEWVQVTPLLPPLTIADGLEIGSAFLVACVIAWGISLVAAQFIPR
jgi:hypothetical protein